MTARGDNHELCLQVRVKPRERIAQVILITVFTKCRHIHTTETCREVNTGLHLDRRVRVPSPATHQLLKSAQGVPRLL